MKMKGRFETVEHEDKYDYIRQIANANVVVGDPIITVSGTQIIPLSQVSVLHLNGNGEYGDVKTFKINEGFKTAGGNGAVVTIKPRGFLVDDGVTCRLLKMDDQPIEAVLNKTQDLVKTIFDQNEKL